MPLWKEVLDPRGAPGEAGHLGFDVVRALSALLTDSVNRPAAAGSLDQHGRLRFAASWQARAGLGGVPLANLYVSALERALAARLSLPPVPRWPAGKRCAIALSHDVDRPVKYPSPLFFKHSRARMARRPARFYAGVAYSSLRQAVDRHADSFWLFDEVTRGEQRLGLKSSFMFAPVHAYASKGSPADVYYDLGWPRFREAFAAIRERGSEIGLHASYRACQDPARFVDEKAELERSSGGAVRGLRHHYWHLGPEEDRTLAAHAAAGLSYDSSIAFNDHPGFRRNIALPFHPRDQATGRAIATLQLPTFCMDSNLFRETTTPERAATEVLDIVRTIRENGGMGAVDWHVTSSYPGNDEYRDWGKAYQEIIRGLASMDDVWTTSLGAVEEHWSARALRPDR